MSDQNAASWGYFLVDQCCWDLDALREGQFPLQLLPRTILRSGQVAGKLAYEWFGIPVGTTVGKDFEREKSKETEEKMKLKKKEYMEFWFFRCCFRRLTMFSLCLTERQFGCCFEHLNFGTVSIHPFFLQ